MNNVTPFDRTPQPEPEEEIVIEPQPWEVRNHACETCAVTDLCCVGKDKTCFETEEWIARNLEMDRLISILGLPAECPNPS